MSESIVVTGIGIISPLGTGKKEFWKNDFSGKSKLKKCEEMIKHQLKSQSYAPIPYLNIHKYLNNKEYSLVKNESRFAKLALIAAKEAISDANITQEVIEKNDIGTIFSSAIGGTPEIQNVYEKLTSYGNTEIRYEDVGKPFYNAGMFNYPATLIASYYGFEGVCASLSTGCTAGMDAMISAMQMINNNDIDMAIVGSSEAPLCSLTYSTLDAIGALSQWKNDAEKASRPFDKKRNGFVISESAVVLVLEKKSHAQKRNKNIYGTVAGISSYNNASHMTDLKDSTVLTKTIQDCLKNAKISPNEIDYINAHGSSTLQNDLCESKAIKTVFHNNFATLPVSSTKSMMGHPLASASLVAIVSSLGAMVHSIVPPNINYDEPDPECNINIITKPFKKEIDNTLVMASGFGGIHSACILSKGSRT